MAPQPTMNRPRVNMSWFWLLAIAGVIIIGYMTGAAAPSEITRKAFVDTMLRSGNVQRVVVVGSERPQANIYMKPEKIQAYKKDARWANIPETGAQFYFGLSDAADFEKEIKDSLATSKFPRNVPVTFENESNNWTSLLIYILPIGLMIYLMVTMSRRMNNSSGGMFSVGKAKAKLFDRENDTKVTFKDVAGLEEAKVEVMEIVDFMKNPKKYSDLGGKIPKGALLVGPPGTGKTLLAKAVAGEANVPFFSISGSDFVEMFVGVGASRVRDLFRQAKEKAPCIVFIDEIDAIGRARGKNSGWSSNDERENTLNQLLTEMDGFGTNAGVIMLAATNRADILDKALLRAGRFDRQINVDLPEVKEREAIFGVHLGRLKLDPTLDTAFLAKQTPGFSGADIANVCNEAALIAARGDKKQVERQDFLDAIDRIVGGLERKNKVLKPGEKRRIAYHEAGHATVSWFMEHANPLLKVTIIPRGKALGAAWYTPEERQITTKDQMIHELAALLGGRAAEETIFGNVSSGALNDLERTTKQAYAMIAYYGMSEKIGNLSFYDSTGQSEMMLGKPYSDQTAQSIDSEVKVLVDNCYVIAREMLEQNRESLVAIAELLLDREVIFTEDLERILGKRPCTDCEPEPAANEASTAPEASAVPETESTENQVGAQSESAENAEKQGATPPPIPPIED